MLVYLRERRDVMTVWIGIMLSAVFTGVIWWAGQRLHSIALLPDAGAQWYLWQLPQPTFWSRATAWGLYTLHQVALWGVIYYAQTHVKRYAAGLHPVNYVALGLNALFIVLHFVQTHVWYDGLAQDVSIFSSQGSVIVLLVWVLFMENQRRGLFWGKRLPIKTVLIDWARRYHGYVFAWAAVYTFWYHPMETTGGHLIGFFYMFLLMIQGSLFFTRVHVNRWWMVAQEGLVLVHATLVAWVQRGATGFWPMFFFGFLTMFIFTQMHGLGLGRRVRWGLFAAYVASIALVYRWRGWDKLNEVVRIPVIEYLAVLILALVVGLIVWGGRRFKRPQSLVQREG